MRVYKDKKYLEFWKELAEALIDDGYIKQARVEEVALTRKWHQNTVMGVFKALDLETFQHEGETYWRLSNKVIPILPNRGITSTCCCSGMTVWEPRIRNTQTEHRVWTRSANTSSLEPTISWCLVGDWRKRLRGAGRLKSGCLSWNSGSRSWS